MKRIVVDEIKDMDLMDVYFMDSKDYKGIQELKEDLNYLQARGHINYLIAKYNMSNDDMIRTDLFDQNSNLIEMDKMTIKEYREMEV